MANTYYFGRDVREKPHNKCFPMEETTFKGFLSNLRKNRHSLDKTREDFEHLPDEEQKRAKLAPYVVAGSPANSGQGSILRTECVSRAFLIALDIDEHKEAETAKKALQRGDFPFNHCWHETITSRPGALRLRVFIEADGIPGNRYKEAVATIARFWGGADNCSKTINQAMFRPTGFKGENLPEVHENNGRRAFTAADIEADALDVPAFVPTNEKDETGGIENLRQTSDDLGAPEIETLLSGLDPDMSHPDWVEVGMSLKHEFQTDPETGFRLWDEWSERGEKYPGQDGAKGTRKKWDSFRANPTDRKPRTIRSLVDRAMKNGGTLTKKRKARELSKIAWCNHWEARPPIEPPQVIHGILHQEAKLMLYGPSKARKTFTLIDLAVSVSSGLPWLGFPTEKGPVLYLDFELQEFMYHKRLREIATAREVEGWPRIARWGLRGHAFEVDKLIDDARAFCKAEGVRLIIIDPLYAALSGGKDENSNSDMAGLMMDFEELAQDTGAAIAIAHHHAKGTAGGKNTIDRFSGAGALARAPDALVDFSPHDKNREKDPRMVCEFVVRGFAKPETISLHWVHPCWEIEKELPPEVSKPKMGRKVAVTAEQAVESVPPEGFTFSAWVDQLVEDFDVKPRTAKARISEARALGLVEHVGEIYRPPMEAEDPLVQ